MARYSPLPLGSALLPTGARLNPLRPAQSEFHRGWAGRPGTYLRCRRENGTELVLFGCGDSTAYPAVGASFRTYHDQTLRDLGSLTVVAVAPLADPTALGVARSLPLYVYK